MRTGSIYIVFLLISTTSLFGGNPNKYWVEFTTKAGTPYYTGNPEAFLSERAIQRRLRFGIPVEESDLPVNPSFISACEKAGGRIHLTSKWFNAVVVIANEKQIKKIKSLDFVKAVSYIGKQIERSKFKRKSVRSEAGDYSRQNRPYGAGTSQITMLNGQWLHEKGYKGEGKMIAVLDGGFSNTDVMPFFDSLYQQNRIIGGRDFVDGDDFVYESSAHGSKVLSVMGANVPGLMIGTAPHATYVLVKTEDVRGEYLLEECNWIGGAEYADSLGVDIINSSLGYSTFTDMKMNYTYMDMDGQTSRASIAADIAFSKGMIVVSSAGNSGDGAWRYINAPADGRYVLAVGATDMKGEKADFSAFGPTYDGRVKPNVVAMGEQIYVASAYSMKAHPSNGTSFSSPLVAGLAAALWEAFPNVSNRDIIQAIEQSGSHARSANEAVGYGIPDFILAYQILQKKQGVTESLAAEKTEVEESGINSGKEFMGEFPESFIGEDNNRPNK